MQLQPHNNQGNPAAIGAARETFALYNEARRTDNGKFFVHTGHSKFWEINRNQRQVYSTGVCTGCTVVVVASGRGIYLHHFKQEVGQSRPFENPQSEEFLNYVSSPFENEVRENRRAFDGDVLRQNFLSRFGDGTVTIQPYSIRWVDGDPHDNTPFGKVVVLWLPPPSNGGDHRLIVRVEENVVLDAHYNADGIRIQYASSPIGRLREWYKYWDPSAVQGPQLVGYFDKATRSIIIRS
ncbi:uncharacterized protein P174DRAFT_502565 [Aspergillus novofumigatus IBT 16806]|uniref:Uncharacterized protein n=1 Tax=Aspergillus novofumigatus (strain IBT 16806) TaxID=1392255 RepID=A0A2I1CBY5_ASPN1|nr:uncharacterized protein P174DRAFT_502565 [Aspergillus novofumigatus IBT 16806]PKX95143.1 hypothetical protein P174DRAFT_502565 [Aspergillus novofumigatus IBT 16806]